MLIVDCSEHSSKLWRLHPQPKVARLVVGFTHDTFASAIRKVRKATPHVSHTNITAAYRATKAVNSSGSAPTNTGTSAVGYFGNSFDTRIAEENGDNLRGECYPDNDTKDVNSESLDGDSGLESEVESDSSDSDSEDEKQCPFDSDYGDLEETGGSCAVQYEDGSEVTLEEHQWECGCDLEAGESEDGYFFAVSDEQSDYESDW